MSEKCNFISDKKCTAQPLTYSQLSAGRSCLAP